MRIQIKLAIVESQFKGYEIERQMGWPYGKLSRVISGIYNPTSEEWDELAAILGKSTHELFPPKRVITGPCAA
jgi:hypothetical protein